MARSNNNNKLKAYVRFDGSGRVVSSSLIVQAFKPKVGNWKEIDAKECCNPTRVVITDTIPGTFPVQYAAINMLCNGSVVAGAFPDVASTPNMESLIQLLNDTESSRRFGTYSAVNATTVQLTVNYSTQANLCPTGTLSFNIFED
jgi:hypothetical protein